MITEIRIIRLLNPLFYYLIFENLDFSNIVVYTIFAINQKNIIPHRTRSQIVLLVNPIPANIKAIPAKKKR